MNVAMFVPVGFLLGCGFHKMIWRRALVIGLCLSVAIELLQLAFKRGFCEMDDVIHNVVGALIGFWPLAGRLRVKPAMTLPGSSPQRRARHPAKKGPSSRT